MPKISAERLQKIGAALLVGAGASRQEADTVSRGCVNANLVGHDSHGVILIPSYVERIKVGHIVPGAPFKIVQESPTTTVIDGHWGFGFVVNERAMRLTIEKAEDREYRRRNRFPPEPCRAARRLSADGGAGRHDRHCHRGFRPLAQSGGAVRRTRGAARHQPDLNRRALRSAGPLCLDMATSAVAVGKLTLAQARGETDPARLDRRQRRQADDRSGALSAGRRAAAAWRHRRLQGQRSRGDRRNPVRIAHRAGFRGRAERAAQ